MDSLRGIAALLVVWLHVTMSFVEIRPILSDTWLYHIIEYVDLGRLGITIFFAISGFVICHSIKGDRKEGTKIFLIRRFFRLFPAFWVSMVLGILIVFIWQGRPISLSMVLGNFSMIPAILGQKLILGLYWTLELELIFYVLVAGLFISKFLRNPMILAILAAGSIGIFSVFILFPELGPSYGPWISSPYHLAIMIWGILFRYWYDRRTTNQDVTNNAKKLNLYFYFLTFSLIAIPIATIGYCFVLDDFEFLNDSTAYLLAFLIVFIGLLKFPIRWKPLVWLGTISYSIYLFHPIVFIILKKTLPTLPGNWMSMHLSFYILLTGLITILLAAAIYYFIEKPSIKLSYRLTNRTR